MKLLKLVEACLIFYATTVTSGFAQSGDNEVTYISPSIIMIGTPDPCYNGGCEEEAVVIEAKGDSNAPLVDVNGMPTSMPVIMRPSVDTTTPSTATAPTTPKAAPVAQQPAPAPTPAATAEAAPAQEAPVPLNESDGQEGKLQMN